MNAADIQIGACYEVRVSNKVVTVRVEDIREVKPLKLAALTWHPANSKTVFDCLNLMTGRRLQISDADRFRGKVPHPAIFIAKVPKM